MISIVVVSTANTVEKSLTVRGRNGEAQFSGTFSVCVDVDGLALSKVKVSPKIFTRFARSSGVKHLADKFSWGLVRPCSAPIGTNGWAGGA